MKIIVHDTASAQLALLRLPPARRPDALREILAPLQEVMSR
ncbi:peptidase, partial [Streptomyces sp. SID7499]|nr:peptidase [Streptomyces sp. SID7499]